MMKSEKLRLNPLENPICMQMPRRNLSSAWMEHVPFALYVLDLVRPDIFVELGTFYGVSYCAFCQAVDELQLPTKCFAVDTWSGDAHMGGYDKGILDNLKRHHDPLYDRFSTLIKSTFDNAVDQFADGTIDLLHIDGFHTYEAVKHDFETWKSKLSRRGVVIFHDTNEYKEDFGVWRFFAEIKARYPHFEFLHGHGLGIAAIGENTPPALLPLFEASEEEADVIRQFFYELGRRVTLHVALAEKEQTERQLRETIQSLRDDLVSRFGLLFRAFEFYRKLVTRFLPNGSRRRQLYDSVMRKISFALNPVKVKHYLGEKAAAWRSSRARRTLGKTGEKAGKDIFLPTVHAKSQPIEKHLAEKSIAGFGYKPLISIVMPTYNTQPRFLEAAIRSVQEQYYPYWELCICDDGSTSSKTLKTLKSISHERIKIIFLEQNEGISAATNRAVAETHGEFIAFLDHDDVLTPDAMFEMVKRLNEQPETDAVYSDQDKINTRGKPGEPFLKPDWSPEYFRAVMYVGHLFVLRRDMFYQAGKFNSEFDGVQDYELMLRVSELTTKIAHIPKILYHWRMIPGSVALSPDEKGSKIEYLQVKAVNSHLRRTKVSAEALQHPTHRHRAMIKPKPRLEFPRISIVIASKNTPEHLVRCLESVFEQTTYPNYEVLVMGDGIANLPALNTLKKYPVHSVPCNPSLNHSQASNLGVRSATGDIIVLLDDKTQVVTNDWLEQMVFYLYDPNISVVGPMLIHPDQTVQHAGIVLGLRGAADHIMRGLPHNVDGYAGSLSSPRNVSAVTGACLMVRRKDYLDSGGLLEYYNSHYQDVDLCLRFLSTGKRIVYVPYAVLIHHEDAINNSHDNLDRALLIDTWSDLIARGDPFYNPNFSLDATDYTVA